MTDFASHYSFSSFYNCFCWFSSTHLLHCYQL